ncbi:PAS domain-containing protein [Caulobacter sp. DWP3-1-3b2]|uniref:sensor histidine kinase n=1 Tax=Caulobacter sp. DWP3-1-3b2 TaxID=2804643 RepID=UPI003CECAAEF
MADTRDQGGAIDARRLGGMDARIEAVDWAATPLGPRGGWSPSLTFAVALVVASKFPTALRWGRDLVLIYNDAYAPMLGERHPKTLGKTFAQAPPTSAADAEAPERAMLDGVSGGDLIEDLLLPTVHADGTVTQGYFTIRLTPLPDPDAASGVGGVLIALSETTRRVQAEQALRASEERYQLALDAASGVGTWDWDIVADRVYANARYAAFHGVSPERAAEGAPLSEFSQALHPDDFERLLKSGRTHMSTTADFLEEYRLRHADGSIRWVQTRGRVERDAKGWAVRHRGVMVDITERKRIEAALEATEADLRIAVEAAGLGRWDHNPATGARYWDPRCREIFGLTEDEKATTETVARLVHPDDYPRLRDGIQIAIDPAGCASDHVFNQEYRIFRGTDGALRWIEAFGRAFFRDGQCVRFVGVASDVTERKKAELHLRLLVNELNHRVKNSLATIQAIAGQTFHAARSLPQAQEAFSARIVALAEAHDLLTRENWEGAELSDLLTGLQALHGAPGRFAFTGPPVRLSPRMALSLSMALHELATNAVKYGALSTVAGHVRIAWSVTSKPEAASGVARLVLTWTESGGPPVSSPARRGFGSRLIERGLAAELSGEAHIDFQPGGVVCRIEAGLEG